MTDPKSSYLTLLSILVHPVIFGNTESEEFMEREAVVARLLHSGNLALESGDLKTAETNFIAAAEMGSVSAIFNLALLERQSGNIKRSIMYFLDAALRGDPEAHLEVGHIYEALGELEKAKDWYQKAKDLGGVTADMYLNTLENDKDWLDEDDDSGVSEFEYSEEDRKDPSFIGIFCGSCDQEIGYKDCPDCTN